GGGVCLFRKQGDGIDGPMPPAFLPLIHWMRGSGEDMEDGHAPPFQGNPSRSRFAPWAKLQRSELQRGRVNHPNAKDLAVEAPNGSLLGAAEFHRVVDQGFEYRLEIERRSADRLQDLGRGGLLFECLCQVLVSPLPF